MIDGALRRAAIRALYKALPLDQRFRGELAKRLNDVLEEGLMTGWKSYIGSTLKTLGGVVAAFAVAQIPQVSELLANSGSKVGALAAVILAIIGNGLRDIGQAHKAERAIEATKENTAAVETAAATVQPVAVVAGPTDDERAKLLNRR